MDLVGFFKRNWYVIVLALMFFGAFFFVGTVIDRQLPERLNIMDVVTAAAPIFGIVVAVLIVLGIASWFIMNRARHLKR